MGRTSGASDGLYDSDFLAWTSDQARRLRALARSGSNVDLDLPHVAEEVDDMGRSQIQAVESLVANVIAHLLKIEHASASQPHAHWRVEIAAWRGDIAARLDDSPSIRGRLDLERAYRRAAAIVRISLREHEGRTVDLPELCPFALERILDQSWYPGAPTLPR